MKINQQRKIGLLVLLLSISLSIQAQNITKQKWHFDDPLTQDTLYGYIFMAEGKLEVELVAHLPK